MGHSSVPVGLFSEKSTPYSFLQNARPPGSLRSPSEPRTALPFLCAFPVGLFSVSAPNRLFKPLRCSAWLIQLRQRTALSPLKRSCFRFASLTLRTPHRPPVSSPLAAAAALWLPCVRGAVRRRAGLRGCLRIRGKGKGRRPSPVSAPNRLFELLRCFARLIRQAETLDLQPLRGLHRSTLCFFFQNTHASAASWPPNPAPSSRFFSISRRSGLRGCRHRAESTHHLTPSGCVPSGGAVAPPAPPLPPPSRCRPDRFKGSP